MASPISADTYGLPGVGPTYMSFENDLQWGPINTWQRMNVVIDAASVDGGSTPTTQLRSGLVLGQVAATQKWKPYSPTATDGTQVPVLILADSVNMIDFDGVTRDKQCPALYSGCVKASRIPNLDGNARRCLNNRFLFDDGLLGYPAPFTVIEPHAASYTVLATDANKMFTTDGATAAVTFTLPNLAPGLRFDFQNTVNQNMIVTAAAGTIIVYNNAAATTVAYQTANKLIGEKLTAVANAAGTAWLVNGDNSAMTIS